MAKYEIKDGVGIIPEGVTVIEEDAFKECVELKSIVIPDSVTEIGCSAFSGCTGLTSIVIPKSVTSIEPRAFYGCAGLTNITIPDSITEIGSSAFRRCSGLTSIVIPESVTVLDDWTFERCTNLASVILPQGLTRIGRGCFENCSSLTEVLIPAKVTVMEQSAFHSCSGLKNVVIQGKLKRIDWNTFRLCSCLESVTLPAGINQICYDHDAFFGCTALKTIYIPAGKGDYYFSRLSPELRALLVEVDKTETKNKKPAKPVVKKKLEELLKHLIVKDVENKKVLLDTAKLDLETYNDFVDDLKYECEDEGVFDIEFDKATLKKKGCDGILFQTICYWAYFLSNGLKMDEDGYWPELYIMWEDYEICFPDLGFSYIFNTDIDTM